MTPFVSIENGATWLWFYGAGLAVGWFFEPVAVALGADDLGVVDDPVDHGPSDGQASEDSAPAGKREVGRSWRRVRSGWRRVRTTSSLHPEVELFQVLLGREPRGFDPCRRAGNFAFGDFTGEDRGQVLLPGRTPRKSLASRSTGSQPACCNITAPLAFTCRLGNHNAKQLNCTELQVYFEASLVS